MNLDVLEPPVVPRPRVFPSPALPQLVSTPTGFEYALMQRLLPRGLLCLADHLYMELHSAMLDQSTDVSLHGMREHEATIFWALQGCEKKVEFHPWA